ncbi:MAG: GAF domain-containing protein [Chloroflexi bacterium]|nr:GAF domain-containing protein [Chloroflexota bacterium]
MATQFDNLQIEHATEEEALSVRELGVLIDIATVVSAASRIGAVYSPLAALVADLIGWDGIIVTTPNDGGRTFTVSLREGEGVPGRAPGTKIGADGALHGETTKRRETLYYTADDTQTAELALRIPGPRHSLLAGFRSFLASPLFSQGEVVGVICVQSLKPHAFSDHDRMLLERIAVFVGPAVDRFAAYETLRLDDLRNKSLLKIGQLLLGAQDIGDVFEQFVEELRTVVEVDRIAIAVAQPGGAALIDRYRHGIYVPNWDEEVVLPMDQLEPNGIDVTSHGYILPHNAMRDTDPAISPGLHANYQAGLRSAMFAALRPQGRLVGTVNVKSVNEDAYGAADLEYFERVADHVAASIERTLANESETEMDRIEEDRIRLQQEERRAIDVIRAKERLLLSASHELRTPLSSMMGFVDLLARNRRGNLDEKQVRYLSIIRRSAEELSGKVDSLIEDAERKSGELHGGLGSVEKPMMHGDSATEEDPTVAEQG